MIGRLFSDARRGFSRDRPADPVRPGHRPAGLREAARLVLPHARRHMRWGLSGLFLALLSILLGYAMPFATRSLVDDVIVPGEPDLLPPILVLLASLGASILITGALQQYAVSRFTGAATVGLQSELIEKTMSLPLALFGRERTGYLMSRVMDDIQGVSWFLSGTSIQLATAAFRVAAGIALMLALEWRLALLAIPAVASIFFASTRISRKLRNLSLHSMEEGARVTSDIEEALSTNAVVRSFRAEDRMTGRIAAGLARLFDFSMERSAAGSVSGIVLDLVPGAARLLVAAAGALLIIRGEWTLGSLLAFNSFLGATLGPARSLASISLGIPQALASVDRVDALLSAASEEPAGGTGVGRLDGRIEFRNVGFSYGDGHPVLRDLSFTIEPGTVLCVTGASGEGKTTLLMLLMGFYRPDSGVILLDGSPIGDLDIRSVRARMGFVPQDPSIMSGTILENVSLGNPSLTRDEALAACSAAGLGDLVGQGGLSLRLGEDGYGLSQGQKQRLAVARALAVEPDILLLDEPTSSLDGSSEESMVKTLEAATSGRTAVVVTHSRALLELATAVLVLDGSIGSFSGNPEAGTGG